MLKACTNNPIWPEKVKTKTTCSQTTEVVTLISVLIAILAAFLVVVIFLPGTIKMLRESGMVGIDVHKPEKPEIPKGGGFVVLFAIVFGILLVMGITTFQEQADVREGLLAALGSILMAGLIGLLDDTFDFRNRTKIVLPLVASIPMIAVSVGNPKMTIPFIGTINFGPFYALLIVPLMMTFIVDSTNMYGGMNGLEAGLSSINASAIVLYVILSQFVNGHTVTTAQTDAGTVAAALLGASIAFFIFNMYPAKVLPGDVGRLPLGAAMASALILGNMDRLAIILYAPFLLNFLLYIVYRVYVKRKEIEYAKFASPREDGTLEVVGPFTMYWILPHFSKKITEKRNVLILLLIQAVIAYGAVMFLLLGYPLGVGIV
jgi:UDP-N-acetylglucosamine--dolichyl-phosphate N-acetylglucosaminephosphotransferase